MRIARVLGSLLFGAVVASTAVLAQEVRTIEINPVSLTLRVGETRTILATPRDARGNPLITTNLSWSSLNSRVLQISFDPNTPSVVTVTGVSVGVAQIEAVSGTVTSQMVISVEAAPQTLALPDSVLPPDIVDATFPQVARIEPQVFEAPPVCRVGGFIGGDLILTTYTAIRGAERINVTLNSGRTIDNVRVATYDVDANLAILHAPGANAGTLTPGSDPGGTSPAWALGQPGCSQTVPIPVRIDGRGGTMSLDRDITDGQIGSPIVDRAGSLIALARGDRSVTPISALAAIMNRGRANAAAGTVASPSDVAERENHRYGTIVVRSDATGTRGRVTPVEDWHWAGLVTDGTFPLTVNGPVGRYRVELLSGGQVRTTETFTVVAGRTTPHVINLPVISAPVPRPGEAQVVTPPSGGGGVSPAIIVLALAAAGGGAFILFGGSTGVDCAATPNDPKCVTEPPPPPGTGTITIRIPIPQ